MIEWVGRKKSRQKIWLADATTKALELASRCPDIDEVLKFWANEIGDTLSGPIALFMIEGNRWLRILPEKQEAEVPFITEFVLSSALNATGPTLIRALARGDPEVVLLQYAGLNSWRGVLMMWTRGARFTLGQIEHAREVASAIGRCLTALRKAELGREQAIALERARWAAELHDGHLQSLSSAKLHAEVCLTLQSQHEELCLTLEGSPVTGTRLRTELARLHDLLRDTVREARQFLLELRSAPVSAEQFLPWLQSYADDFSRETGIHATVRVEGAGEMTPAQVEETTRLIREAMTNVRKHAKAGFVRIVVASSEQATSISISDDGVGFDVRSKMEELLDSSHNGLIGIRYRAESVGGEMRLRSEVGKGTTLHFRFPRPGRKGAPETVRRRSTSTPARSEEGSARVLPLVETSVRDSIRETLAEALTSYLESEGKVSAPDATATNPNAAERT